MIKKSFVSADDNKQPADKIKMETVQFDDLQVSQVTCQPGWRWSVDLKPVFKTESCPVDHLLYMVSGTMAVHMDDGQELSFSPGDIAHIPPGHDGWGTSDEPTVWIEIPH